MRTILTNDNPPKRIYLPTTILSTIRWALVVLAFIMIFVAWKVPPYAVLKNGWQKVPFAVASVVSLVWAWGVHRRWVIAVASTVLTVMFFSRAAELALWGPHKISVVGAATWMLVSAWCLLLGIINQIAITHKKAGELCGLLQT